MKWIGTQIIYDHVRLNKGITLDSVSITTIQSSGESFADNDTSLMTSAAILDKIQATASGDITGVTAGTGLSGGGTSGGVTLNVEASIPEITTLAGVTAIGTASNNLDITNDLVRFNSANANDPLVLIKNTANDATSGRLRFLNERGVDGQDDDETGIIEFFSYDDGSPSGERYARIIGTIHDATATEESGKLSLQVASHDGGDEDGLVLTGGSVDAEVDVTIGNGSASVVTIPGHVDLAGDIDVDGTLEADAITLGGTALGSLYSPIAGSSSIVTTGTIGTGVWQGTAIASAYLDADTAHYSATRQVTHHMITDDIDSDVIYISLGEIDSEGTSATGKHLPLIAPTAGKLLKIFLRTSVNYSSETFTWKLYTRNVSASTGGSPSEIGAQSGAGPTNKTMVTYDFTTGLDSGTNAIAAGDKVQISVEAGDGATANGNYFITCMWEWDLS